VILARSAVVTSATFETPYAVDTLALTCDDISFAMNLLNHVANNYGVNVPVYAGVRGETRRAYFVLGVVLPP